MRIRRILPLLLILALLLPAAVACGGAKAPAESGTTEPPAVTPEGTTEPATEEVTEPAPVTYELENHPVSENLSSLKLLGRSLVRDNSVILDWSAAGVSFRYHGAGALRLTATRTGAAKDVELVVTVDARVYSVSVGSVGQRTYVVPANVKDGDHTVTIRRKTMVEQGAQGVNLTLDSVWFGGSFLARPADNTYQVAFIGDSITCGVGLVNTTTAAENGVATYAVDFADRENVDYDICAISGIGVYRSTTKHGYTTNNMTKYYPYFNYYRDPAITYTPARKADLVVVNLNTNDNGNGRTDDDKTAYQTALKQLISEIRAAHGANVPIVWVVGMMIAQDAPTNQWLNEVFDELGGETAGLYRLLVDTNQSGGASHPNSASHRSVSQKLSAFIREKNLLDLG